MWKLVLLILFFSCRPNQKFATGTKWQIQFNGELQDTSTAKVFDVDLFDSDENQLKLMKKQGKKIICYFSAGTYENWRPDAKDFPEAVRGQKLKDWEGESWLNIRDLEVKNIMSKRIAMAKNKGCDAIDPDNVDGYTHQNGFELTEADQLKYNKFLAEAAHDKKLLIGLKNNLRQVSDLVDFFDFAINESCAEFKECHLLKPFALKRKPILAISYQAKSKALCKEARKMHMDIIFKNKKLDEKIEYCD